MINDRLSVITALFAAFLTLVSGCSRQPEDLEQWRNAKKGVQKFTNWTASPEQSEAVRQRALELLVIDKHYEAISKALDPILKKETTNKLIGGVVPTIRQMWEKQDMPTSDDISEAKQKGESRIAVNESDTVHAKDAAYYLLPYAEGSDESFLRGILDEWLQEDWQVRDQLGRVSFEQLISRVSKEGARHLADWMKETQKPIHVTELINQFGDSEIQDTAANALKKRLQEMHPEIDANFRTAMLMTQSEKIVPYLKTAIESDKSEPKLIDDALDALIRIQKEKAVPFLQKIIETKKGKLRWIAAQRIIELRGKAGFLIAAKALPTDREQYREGRGDVFKQNAEFFCNFYSTEMEKTGVASVTYQLRRGVEHDKWPVRLLATLCIKETETTSLRDELEDLEYDDEHLPAWPDRPTVGEIAEDTLEAIE